MNTVTALRGGLSSQEVQTQRVKYGPNEIYKPVPIRFWDIAREEVTEPMIVLLIVAGVIYSLLGELRDAVTIFAIIVVLVLSEVATEYRAKTAIAALQKIAAVKTRVRRNQQTVEIDALDVVPDDVLVLSQGTKIAAEATVQQSIGLQVDESALTGESFPVEKKVGDPLFGGTFVLSGEGQAVVTVIGAQTRLGQIAAKAQAIKPPRTALQLAMKSLAGKLVYVALFFAIGIPLLGYLRGQDWKLMLLTGLALAFAIIPEELPIVITMVLGLGSYRLSNRKFLIKQLKTAEALGNTTTIVTDKTGTITEGHLKIVATFPERADPVIEAALLSASEYSSTPIEAVIKERAAELGLKRALPDLVRERDRGDGKKTRATVRREGSTLTLYKSGAPEEVFASCQTVPDDARAELERQTQAGRRVIAVAYKPLAAPESDQEFESIEQGMTVSGLIAFEDTPRPGVKDTIASAAKAGIRTIMVTGDHPLTAAYIARQVGIDTRQVLTGEELDRLSDETLRNTVREVSVFARTTPEHKYRIVKALQDNHEVVAVTGDGINDVLALKAADIGIAMGIKGTDVAKEAASVVLADDNFNTIAMGIFEGRVLFDNLQKGMKYYLCIKLALILIFMIPVILNYPLPFAPIQIILLELFMDLAASAGFVAEPQEKSIYTRPPRDPNETVFNNRAIVDIFVRAGILFAAVTGVYLYTVGHGASLVEAQTLAFAAWMVGHIVLAFISRSDREPVIALGVFSNPVMTLWALGAIAFLLLGIYVPYLNGLLRLTAIAVPTLLLSTLIVVLVLLLLEVRKIIFPAQSR